MIKITPKSPLCGNSMAELSNMKKVYVMYQIYNNLFMKWFSTGMLIIIFIFSFACGSDKPEPEPEPQPEPDEFNITGVSIPSKIDVFNGDDITFTGKGFQTGDLLKWLTTDASKTYIVALTTVTEQSITFKLPVEVESGWYRISVVRNEKTKYLASISLDVIIIQKSMTFPTGGGTQTASVNTASDWYIEHVSDRWINATKTGNSTLSVTVDGNYSDAALTGEITLKVADYSFTISIFATQVSDPALFLNAATEMGRRFVYNSKGLVSNIISDKQYALNDQVSVLEIAYMGSVTGADSPYRVFLFDVRLENGTTLRMTTANDEDSSIKTASEVTVIQIMRGQLAAMQNKRNATTDVLAGVNGDFASTNGTYLPHGVLYRRGVAVKPAFSVGATTSTVFAVMKDGTACVMNQTQFAQINRNDILEAIGGQQPLLSNGYTMSNDAVMNPRTAVGVSREKNRVFLLVVDGRRDDYSIGASYPMLARMLLAMGAYDAINLDGGGSSTFVIKTSTVMPATQNSFTTLNRPTDNAGDRAVANGIAIVKE